MSRQLLPFRATLLLGLAGLSLAQCDSSSIATQTQPLVLRTAQIVAGSAGQSSSGSPAVWPPLDQIPGQATEDPSWAWGPPNPTHIPLPPNTVSLTFDDGPDTNTLSIATYLAQHGIRATFFVVGCHFQGHQAGGPLCQDASDLNWPTSVLAKLVSLGHRVANHTEYHCELTGRLGAGASPCYESDACTRMAPDGTCLEWFGRPYPAGTIPPWLATTQRLLDPFITDGMNLFRAPTNGWNASVADAVMSNPYLDKLTGSFAYDSFAGDWNCTDPKVHESVSACANDYKMDLPPATSAGILQLHDRNPNDVHGDFTYRTVQCLVGGHTQDCPGNGVLQQQRFVPLDAIPGVRGQLSFNPPPPAFPTVYSDFFADANHWDADPGTYGTIRLGDLDADGDADVCGRNENGVYCARSDRTAMVNPHLYLSALSNSQGWGPPQYSTTIKLADIDGDRRADLCARGVDGLYCFKGDGQQFAASPTWWSPDFSDAATNGAGTAWGTYESYYRSIHLGDVNGDGFADVCGRGKDGVYCALANRPDLCPSSYHGFCPGRYWLPTDLGDPSWLPRQLGSTVQLADVDGDGKADVCGRSARGIVCARSNGSGFEKLSAWTSNAFTDTDFWYSENWNGMTTQWYRTIHFADIDGDGRADVCGRSATGVECAVSNGASFVGTRYVYNHDFLDATGWSPPQYGTTFVLGDVDGNGHADVCARGVYGLACATAP
jgi:hypothetical protein